MGLYPGWVQTVARFLPTTLGIDTNMRSNRYYCFALASISLPFKYVSLNAYWYEATRKVILEGKSLGALWTQGTLPWLVAHAALLTALGWVVFLTSDRQAMRRGIVS